MKLVGLIEVNDGREPEYQKVEFSEQFQKEAWLISLYEKDYDRDYSVLIRPDSYILLETNLKRIIIPARLIETYGWEFSNCNVNIKAKEIPKDYTTGDDIIGSITDTEWNIEDTSKGYSEIAINSKLIYSWQIEVTPNTHLIKEGPNWDDIPNGDLAIIAEEESSSLKKFTERWRSYLKFKERIYREVIGVDWRNFSLSDIGMKYAEEGYRLIYNGKSIDELNHWECLGCVFRLKALEDLLMKLAINGEILEQEIPKEFRHTKKSPLGFELPLPEETKDEIYEILENSEILVPNNEGNFIKIDEEEKTKD